MAIAAIDVEVSERLELPTGPYSTDDGLALGMLNAMIRRGWRPTLDYDHYTAFWNCMLRHPDGLAFHHASHESIARAIVSVCLGAIDPR